MSDKKLDETIPGGRYKVGNRYVNANGETVGSELENGEASEETPNGSENGGTGADASAAARKKK